MPLKNKAQKRQKYSFSLPGRGQRKKERTKALLPGVAVQFT
jgi:hypothetical protein